MPVQCSAVPILRHTTENGKGPFVLSRDETLDFTCFTTQPLHARQLATSAAGHCITMDVAWSWASAAVGWLIPKQVVALATSAAMSVVAYRMCFIIPAACVCVVLAIVQLWTKWVRHRSGGMPGPNFWWLFRHFNDFHTASVELAKEHGGIYNMFMGNRTMAVVSDPKLLQQVSYQSNGQRWPAGSYYGRLVVALARCCWIPRRSPKCPSRRL